MTPFGLDQATITAVSWTVLCLLAGMTVPTEYGLRQMQGFGRWVFNKVPTAPAEEIEEVDAGGES
ncbi:hypothetical protein ACFR9U_17230 [Halorientalis brevis]|uniref:Uncharacterized protein n=1 Tax=Halorientalis brevis TaxID=1126241 RepID=A0ABD6CHD1_9EURY|nr:hypothetical protein [Halorientalis brevis]